MSDPRDPQVMRQVALDTLFTNTDELADPNQAVSADAHAITAALIYVGDLLNGIGYLYANQPTPAPLHSAVHAEDERLAEIYRASVRRQETTQDAAKGAVLDLRYALAGIDIHVDLDAVTKWDELSRSVVRQYIEKVSATTGVASKDDPTMPGILRSAIFDSRFPPAPHQLTRQQRAAADRIATVAREARMPAMHVHFAERRDLRPHVVADLLALVNVRVTSDQVSAWDADMREQAADYATAAHLRASDNPDVVIPPRPDFLPTP